MKPQNLLKVSGQRLTRICESIIDVFADLIVIVVILLVRSVTRLVPRIIAAIANFFLAVLNTSAVTSAVVVGMIFFCGIFGWYVAIPYFNKEPARVVERFNMQPATSTQSAKPGQLPERLRIDLSCPSWAGADDMRDPQDRLAAAITVVNVAIDKAQKTPKTEGGEKFIDVFADTCSVFQSYETLAVLGKSFDVPRSEGKVAFALKWLAGVSSPQAVHDETEEMLRDYMKDPKPYLKDRPWLTESRRYNRVTWKSSPWPQTDPKGMRVVMCRLYGVPDQTPEFFRYKKSPDEVCPQS